MLYLIALGCPATKTPTTNAKAGDPARCHPHGPGTAVTYRVCGMIAVCTKGNCACLWFTPGRVTSQVTYQLETTCTVRPSSNTEACQLSLRKRVWRSFTISGYRPNPNSPTWSVSNSRLLLTNTWFCPCPFVSRIKPPRPVLCLPRAALWTKTSRTATVIFEKKIPRPPNYLS